MKVIVLGRGKLGRALAASLRAADVDVALLPGRRAPQRFKRGVARTFVLCVPDGAIRALSERLAPQMEPGDVVLHCAGARDHLELSACRARGAAVAGMHPLVSFADARKLAALRGATFVAMGDARALARARTLCRKLEAHCLCAPILGPTYHAAAALLANGGAALAFAAKEILTDLGVKPRDAERALGALLGSVAANVRSIGLPRALTGPVARGDSATVRRHRLALGRLAARHRAAYVRVQPLIERCAEAQARGRAAQRQK